MIASSKKQAGRLGTGEIARLFGDHVDIPPERGGVGSPLLFGKPSEACAFRAGATQRERRLPPAKLDRARYPEAVPLFQQALYLREQLLGSEHTLVATSLNKLATLYAEQGKYGEAEPLFQRALRIWERQLGPEHPDVARALNKLATLYYYEHGKYGEAEPLFQRALRIWMEGRAWCLLRMPGMVLRSPGKSRRQAPTRKHSARFPTSSVPDRFSRVESRERAAFGR